MFCMTHIGVHRVGPGAATWLLTFAALAGMTESLLAQATSAPFTVRINEMLAALDTGQTMATMNGMTQDIHRNMPYLEVKNNSTASLLEFQLTIGDDMYHFSDDHLGAYAVPGTTPPGVDLSATTSDNENRLIVTFSNGGLKLNDIARFKIDLDVDAAMASLVDTRYPAFFTVLVDNQANSQSNDNAIPYARFSNSTSLVQLPPLLDFLLIGADGQPSPYYNGNHARFGTMLPIAQVVSGVSAVPEPGSFVLAGLGLLGLFGRRCRSRRRSEEN